MYMSGVPDKTGTTRQDTSECSKVLPRFEAAVAVRAIYVQRQQPLATLILSMATPDNDDITICWCPSFKIMSVSDRAECLLWIWVPLPLIGSVRQCGSLGFWKNFPSSGTRGGHALKSF